MSTQGHFEDGQYRIALSAAAGAGGVVKVANPEGRRLRVKLCLVDASTKATAAATINAGIGDGTADVDNLIDGLDVGTAAIVASNVTNPGTNGKAEQTWGPNQFLVISQASGNVAGLAGEVVVEWTVMA
jgi:hypothetical protein